MDGPQQPAAERVQGVQGPTAEVGEEPNGRPEYNVVTQEGGVACIAKWQEAKHSVRKFKDFDEGSASSSLTDI